MFTKDELHSIYTHLKEHFVEFIDTEDGNELEYCLVLINKDKTVIIIKNLFGGTVSIRFSTHHITQRYPIQMTNKKDYLNNIIQYFIEEIEVFFNVS